jgi:hypothetical protein
MAKDKLSNIQKGKEKISEAKQKVKNLMTKLSILSATQNQEQTPQEQVIIAPQVEPVSEQKGYQPFVSKKKYRDYTAADWAQVEADKQRAMDIFAKQEAQYNLKLQKEAEAKTLEAEFQEYIISNPPSMNQYGSPGGSNMREQDPVYIRRAIESDKVFTKSTKVETNNNPETIQKTKNIIEHLVTPNIKNYFMDEFAIDLGNIDTSFSHIDTYKTELDEDSYAAVHLMGKVANNTLVLSPLIIEDIENFKSLTSKNLNNHSIRMVNALTHEVIHKMFNLDNRLSIDRGANVEYELIKVKHREAMVEYFARKIHIKALVGSDKISPLQKREVLDWLNKSGAYQEYVNNLNLNLNDLAIKLTDSDNPNSKGNFFQNRKYVEKLMAEFFLTSDDTIINIAKDLGHPNILEY